MRAHLWLLLAPLAGALAVPAFAPWQLWPLAFVSLGLYCWCIDGQSPRNAFWRGLGWGLGHFGAGVSWVYFSISDYSDTPLLLALLLTAGLIAFLALFPAGVAWCCQRYLPADASRWYLGLPLFWGLGEALRGWIFTGFPWLNLGYSQESSWLAGLVPLGGAALASLYLVWLSASTYAWLRQPRQWRALLVPLLLLAFSLPWPGMTWVEAQAPRYSVTLVQGNIPQDDRWLLSERERTLYRYLDLSTDAWDSDLLIWPEAAIPALPYEVANYLDYLREEAEKNGTAFITGIPTLDEQQRFYNSVISFGQASGEYHKHQLVPFGEFVPFEQQLRGLAGIFNLPMSSFSRGPLVQPPLQVRDWQMAVALCYEVAFAEQVRRNFGQADLLLTLSNDAWFGASLGPDQHLQLARFRALELGRPVIRATNNGITAVIDGRGQEQARIPQFSAGLLKTELATWHGDTPYRRGGFILPWVLLTGMALLLCFHVWRLGARPGLANSSPRP